MKKSLRSILTILFVSGISYSNAQPSIQWQKSLGGSNSDDATYILQTADGGYIIAGVSISNDGDVTGHHDTTSDVAEWHDDYWIVKLSNIGVIQWEESLGGLGDDEASSIALTTDGGYIVAGWSNSNDGDVTGNHNYSYDYWIVKLDSAGAIQWEESLGGTSDDYANSIQQTSDGGYIVAGFSYSNDGDLTSNHGGADYWIVKLNSSGNIQWQESLGGTSDDEPYSIKQTKDGGYIIAGYSESNDGNVSGNHNTTGGYPSDYWIVKLNSTGAIQWQKCYGGSDADAAYDIYQCNDNGYIICGVSFSIDGDITNHHGADVDDYNADYWVVKTDSTGLLQWQKSLGGSAFDDPYSIRQTTDGGYIVAGSSGSDDGDVTFNNGGLDYWIVKLNNSGIVQWQESFGGSGDESLACIQQTVNGGYVIAGSTNSNDGDVTGHHGSTQEYNDDYWIVKLSSVSGIKEYKELSDFQIYPNPGSDQITIHPSSFNGEKLTISITNVLGQELLSPIVLQEKDDVIYINNLSPGIYFLQMKSENSIITQKFIKE